MKRAKDILRQNYSSYVTIQKDASALDAFALMEKVNTDYVIVMEGWNCIGVISEVDYLHKVILSGKDPAQTKAIEIMSSPILSVDMEEPIYRCLEFMDILKTRHLIITDRGMLKGMVTLHDLMHAEFVKNVDYLLEKDKAIYVLNSSIPGNQQHYADLCD